MSLLEAIVLGIVQGLTEFLPISSTAHLRIVPALLKWEDPGPAFSAVIQLGTVIAVLLYFSKDLLRLSKAFIAGVLEKKPFGTPDARLAWAVIIGTIPISIVGLLFKHHIKTTFRSLWVISASLIALAVILAVVERIAKRNRTLETITVRDGVIVGLWQALALIPGSSRSGTTLTGSLILGMNRSDAARFSFLLSIPATTLAGLFSLKDVVGVNMEQLVVPALISTIVAFVTGLVAIWGLMRLLKTHSTMPFVFYRIALGLLLIGLLTTGVLQP